MIRSFRHKGLKKFFLDDDASGLNQDHVPRIRRLLDRLDASKSAEDMNLPGYRFHALKGDRKGDYAVSVSGNWRITFKFDGENAERVDLEDYH